MFLLGIIFFISSIVLGAALSDYFFSEYVSQRLIRFAIGVPIGFALAAYIVLALDILSGAFRSSSVLFASILMVAASSYLFAAKLRNGINARKFAKELRDYRALYCGIFLISLVLIILQYQGLRYTPQGIIGGDNFGVDFLFHLGIGNSLIYNKFPPNFPYASGIANVYPFIPDFFSAILVYSGLGLVDSFYLMNFLLYFSLTAIGSYLFFRLSKNQWVPSLAMIIFLFCGQGVSLILMGVLNIPLYGHPFASTYTEMHTDFLYLITYPLFNYDQPLLNIFAPQHEYLLGFPLALSILSIGYLAFAGESKRKPNASILFLGFLVGLMPLIHPPSFAFLLVFGFVMLVYLVFAKKGKERMLKLKRLAELGIVAMVVSLPELLFIHSQHLANPIISESITNPVWYSAGDGILSLIIVHAGFWLEVFGPVVAIGFAGMLLLNKRQLLLFVPPLILFAIINFLWFPPGFGDSNKYTLYLLFFLGFACAVLLQRLFNSKRRLFKAIALILLLSIILNGFAEEYFDFAAVYPVANNLALNASSWLLSNTNSSSLFVTNCYLGTFDYLPTIAARRTLLDIKTYTQPLGIYNYNMTRVSADINGFMQNPSCSFAKKYNVSYLVIDNLSYLQGPNSCAPVNYTAVMGSPNVTMVSRFSNATTNEEIIVFRTSC